MGDPGEETVVNSQMLEAGKAPAHDARRTNRITRELGCLVILALIVLSGGPCGGHRAVRELVRRKKSEDKLKQLYAFLTIYANSHGCYPSMQSTNALPRQNGGACDLYPLYLAAPDKEEFLQLLVPPGVSLARFSWNPGPDEFDSGHVGYLYNSAVILGQSNIVPLMAERCVEDGMFTPDEKPVFKDCGHILMSDGGTKQVPVVDGKLQLGDIKVEDLGRLK